MLTPFFPNEVGAVEPSLIDIENALAFVEEVEHHQGKLLPENKGPLAVCLLGNELDLFIPH